MTPIPGTRPPLVQRARKAFNAAAMAAAGAFVTSLVTAAQTAHVPKTAEGWTALVLSAVGVGILAGISTYKIRNVATVEGSDPVVPAAAPPTRTPLT